MEILENQNLFYSFYIASVTDNKDPEHRGRLRTVNVEVNGGVQMPGWIPPFSNFCTTSGVAFLPEIGQNVIIICRYGDPRFQQWLPYSHAFGDLAREGSSAPVVRECYETDEPDSAPKHTVVAAGNGNVVLKAAEKVSIKNTEASLGAILKEFIDVIKDLKLATLTFSATDIKTVLSAPVGNSVTGSIPSASLVFSEDSMDALDGIAEKLAALIDTPSEE